jgi:hypothetical protein
LRSASITGAKQFAQPCRLLDAPDEPSGHDLVRHAAQYARAGF